jgi:hypothetical protein
MSFGLVSDGQPTWNEADPPPGATPSGPVAASLACVSAKGGKIYRFADRTDGKNTCPQSRSELHGFPFRIGSLAWITRVVLDPTNKRPVKRASEHPNPSIT